MLRRWARLGRRPCGQKPPTRLRIVVRGASSHPGETGCRHPQVGVARSKHQLAAESRPTQRDWWWASRRNHHRFLGHWSHQLLPDIGLIMSSKTYRILLGVWSWSGDVSADVSPACWYNKSGVVLVRSAYSLIIYTAWKDLRSIPPLVRAKLFLVRAATGKSDCFLTHCRVLYRASVLTIASIQHSSPPLQPRSKRFHAALQTYTPWHHTGLPGATRAELRALQARSGCRGVELA